MDTFERWNIEREVFRKWLAERDWLMLLDIAEDLKSQMDYEMAKKELFGKDGSFSKFMEGR